MPSPANDASARNLAGSDPGGDIDASSTRPVIGLWGCFDTDSLGDQLTLRVVRAALGRRLPRALVRAFAPVGSTRRTVLASAEIVEPLLPADDVHVRALDASLALVVVTGDEPRWRTDALVAEYGIDREAGQRLEALVLGTADGFGPVRVRHGTTHPAVLASAVVDADLRARRLGFVRAVGWAPPAGPFVAVQADRTDQISDATRALRGDEAVVVVPAGGDEVACAALASALSTPYVLPPIASLDDRVAVLLGADRVVATDLATQAVAAADDTAVTDLESEYDAIAARLEATADGPLVLPEIDALRAALDARGRRLDTERVAFADALRAAHAERDHARAELAHLAESRRRPSWSAVLRRITGRS